jgi:hypothetical protein
MNQQDTMGLLLEIAEGADTAKWSPLALTKDFLEKDPTGKGYRGLVGEWTVTVLSFQLEPPQPGARGYDGMCVRQGKIIRLTNALAAKIFGLAEKAHEHLPKE